MKTIKGKLIYTLAIMLSITVLSCAVRKSEPITGEIVNVNDPHVQNGRVLYHDYCQKCHPAGEAGLGPSVTSKPGFIKKFQVRHGWGVMPAFDKKVISKQELQDIVAYLKNLNRLD